MPPDEARQTTSAAIARGKADFFNHHPERNIKKDIMRGQTTMMTGSCRLILNSKKIFHVRMMFYHLEKLFGSVIISLF